MRTSLQDEMPLLEDYAIHAHGRELRAMSEILDSKPQLAEKVCQDLVGHGAHSKRGRKGMTGDQVLRVIVVKLMTGFSYEQLCFHLADSTSYRTFCRIGYFEGGLKRATLQENVKKVRAETLEEINRTVVLLASKEGVEGGRKVRVDCTVVESDIHAPTDSSILADAVRVLSRGLETATEDFAIPSIKHARRAKRRALGILNARSTTERTQLYRDLLKVTRKTLENSRWVIAQLLAWPEDDLEKRAQAEVLASELRHYADLTARVIDQTTRRVLEGETVPAEEKVVSIFEPHTDIIVKDRRETLYGHKICLTTGASSMVLDCVVEEGNPADSTLAEQMIARQCSLYERPPRQAALDGGFSSRSNLENIKGMGVKDVAFSKGRGLKLSEMVKSSWVYKRLRNFRAGVEGCISFLKRCFGLDRCKWHGFESFKSYVWSSIVSANLLILARHRLATAAANS